MRLSPNGWRYCYFTRQHSGIDEIPSRFCAIFGSVKTRGFEGAPELLYKVTRSPELGNEVERDISSRELPEVLVPGEQEDGGPGSYTIEDVKARQSKSVMKWLEHRVGAEKLQLAKLLQEHNVIVRGGAEQGQKLMDALLNWKESGATEGN